MQYFVRNTKYKSQAIVYLTRKFKRIKVQNSKQIDAFDVRINQLNYKMAVWYKLKLQL